MRRASPPPPPARVAMVTVAAASAAVTAPSPTRPPAPRPGRRPPCCPPASRRWPRRRRPPPSPTATAAGPAPCPPARSTEHRRTPSSRECRCPAGRAIQLRGLRVATGHRCPLLPFLAPSPSPPFPGEGNPSGELAPLAFQRRSGSFEVLAYRLQRCDHHYLSVLDVAERRNLFATQTSCMTGEWCAATLTPFKSCLWYVFYVDHTPALLKSNR